MMIIRSPLTIHEFKRIRRHPLQGKNLAYLALSRVLMGFASKGQVAPKGRGLPQKSVGQLVKRLLQAHRAPGPPCLLFHQHVKPVGAGAGDRIARLFFPGHFIPAPFFNEGTALVGT
jgi:hypothetical protein